MKNILLVDDDEAAHTYHRLMIEMASIDVRSVKSAYNVDEAINYLHTINEKEDIDAWPNYIFIDLNMPNKSGYDFIEEFSQLTWKSPTPQIYFVSSTKNPLDIDKASSIDILKGFETKFLQKEFFESLEHETLPTLDS